MSVHVTYMLIFRRCSLFKPASAFATSVYIDFYRMRIILFLLPDPLLSMGGRIDKKRIGFLYIDKKMKELHAIKR